MVFKKKVPLRYIFRFEKNIPLQTIPDSEAEFLILGIPKLPIKKGKFPTKKIEFLPTNIFIIPPNKALKSPQKRKVTHKKPKPTPKLFTHKKTKLAEYAINMNKLKIYIFFSIFKSTLVKVLKKKNRFVTWMSN